MAVLVMSACAGRPATWGLGTALAHPRDGRYSASVVVASGSCCSESCNGVTTDSHLALELHPDGRARLGWTVRGCEVTTSGSDAEMPEAPPVELCDAPLPGEERASRTLDREGAADGRWRREGWFIDVELEESDASWQLRCASVSITSSHGRRADGVLACRANGIDELMSRSLATDGFLYLGDVDRLTVRRGRDDVSFDLPQ